MNRPLLLKANERNHEAARRIYALKSGLRYGPYSLDELQKELDSGFFTPNDFALYEGNDDYVHRIELPGLAFKTFAVEIDSPNNLLVIRYRGRVDAATVRQCLARVKEALEKLEPEFQLLVDLTELEFMDAGCIPHLEEIMEVCDRKGVSVVLRIISDPKRDIGLQIMSHFHYHPRVRVMTCATKDEAMARLAM